MCMHMQQVTWLAMVLVYYIYALINLLTVNSYKELWLLYLQEAQQISSLLWYKKCISNMQWTIKHGNDKWISVSESISMWT